jgi:hypothetical protein
MHSTKFWYMRKPYSTNSSRTLGPPEKLYFGLVLHLTKGGQTVQTVIPDSKKLVVSYQLLCPLSAFYGKIGFIAEVLAAKSPSPETNTPSSQSSAKP